MTESFWAMARLVTAGYGLLLAALAVLPGPGEEGGSLRAASALFGLGWAFALADPIMATLAEPLSLLHPSAWPWPWEAPSSSSAPRPGRRASSS